MNKKKHLVSTSVAVVGSREDGDDISVMGPVVTLHHQLMCPCDQCESVWVVECFWYVLMCKKLKQRQISGSHPGQKCSLHPWERFPSLLCHQGHSTGGRTLGLHVAPLVDGQGPWKCAHVVTCVTWLWKIGLPDVIKSVYAWTEASMEAEDLSIHKGGQG